MITILASPKPFIGIDKENQYRAINNWKTISCRYEIILYGNSIGIENAGKDLNVKVVNQIRSTENGIPYFGAIVEHASKYGEYDTQLFLNCDILLSNIDEVLFNVKFQNFLIIGQRIDLSEGTIIDQSISDFEILKKELLNLNKAKLHEPTGVDYFIFKKNQWNNIDEIVIGRGGYDSALLNFTKKSGIPIIDATNSIIALHQFHNYNHVKGSEQTVFYGIDAKNNLLHAGKHSLLTISDSDYAINKDEILYFPCRGDKIRQFELFLRYKIKLVLISKFVRLFWRAVYFNKK